MSPSRCVVVGGAQNRLWSHASMYLNGERVRVRSQNGKDSVSRAGIWSGPNSARSAGCVGGQGAANRRRYSKAPKKFCIEIPYLLGTVH